MLAIEEIIESGLEPLRLLSKDLRRSATQLTPSQARYLVDLYYQVQEYRKRAANQGRAMTESGEPHELVKWVFGNMEVLENNIRRALDGYSEAQVPGRWAKSICGIGPVLSAGLLAHIDITQAPTVGHIWRFAGLDSTSKWIGAESAKALVKDVIGARHSITTDDIATLAARTNRKPVTIKAWDAKTKSLITETNHMTPQSLASGLARRPWNAKLKVLCWLAGESFVKVSNNKNDVYGHIYAERKEEEQAKNEAGQYAEQATAALAAKRIGKDTEAYKWYSAGKLPPAHIHARAKRYATKLFLSHMHHVMYESHYGTAPPKPYIFTRPEHTHYISPPNWPM